MLLHPSACAPAAVRLAYCLNLHAGDSLAAVRAGIERITVPLSQRLSGGAPFGVGMYLPAAVAFELQAKPSELNALGDLLGAHSLDPFTYNAFPFGGFHDAGLKSGVFRPTWDEPERLAYTLAVARCATSIATQLGLDRERHLSISTHTGFFGPGADAPERVAQCAAAWLACAEQLHELEERSGYRIVLSLEPEPRSAAGDTRGLATLFDAIRTCARTRSLERVAERHLGVCLDACHAAVEFEAPDEAIDRCTAFHTPLGKVQFSSALRLARPVDDPEGVAALLALAEPTFLHQVTGRRGDSYSRVHDLPELERELATADSPWLECDEWRCHFHVPVDLDRPARAGSLATTRSLADELLARLLDRRHDWGTRELHLEIETYTWDLLPGAARGTGALIDGLEREYRHVFDQLAPPISR